MIFQLRLSFSIVTLSSIAVSDASRPNLISPLPINFSSLNLDYKFKYSRLIDLKYTWDPKVPKMVAILYHSLF